MKKRKPRIKQEMKDRRLIGKQSGNKLKMKLRSRMNQIKFKKRKPPYRISNRKVRLGMEHY